MIDGQIYISLRKKLKAGTFWQKHTEHGMCLLQTAFLTTPHRITVINMRAPGVVDTCFQCVWINKVYSTFCAVVHEKSNEQFLLCENMVSRFFFDSLEECTVSISTNEVSPRSI